MLDLAVIRRVRRVDWIPWAAPGNPSPLADLVTVRAFRAHCSRPTPRVVAHIVLPSTTTTRRPRQRRRSIRVAHDLPGL